MHDGTSNIIDKIKGDDMCSMQKVECKECKQELKVVEYNKHKCYLNRLL